MGPKLTELRERVDNVYSALTGRLDRHGASLDRLTLVTSRANARLDQITPRLEVLERKATDAHSTAFRVPNAEAGKPVEVSLNVMPKPWPGGDAELELDVLSRINKLDASITSLRGDNGVLNSLMTTLGDKVIDVKSDLMDRLEVMERDVRQIATNQHTANVAHGVQVDRVTAIECNHRTAVEAINALVDRVAKLEKATPRYYPDGTWTVGAPKPKGGDLGSFSYVTLLNALAYRALSIPGAVEHTDLKWQNTRAIVREVARRWAVL